MSVQGFNPVRYAAGDDRYIRFIEDYVGIELAAVQKRILRHVATNQRTIIWGANGPGKSYITAALKLAFLFSNPDSIVLGTSGSYRQYYDTMWRPLENMFEDMQEEHGFPGNAKGGEDKPSLELDNEWYAKVVSPRDPGELEGRHGSDVLVVLDEADKKYVTDEHFDSANSSITDLNDKMVAICNPPEDETNIVAQKKNSPRWTVVELSAFESHNALVDAGLIGGDHIEGLVDLITIASDWEEYTNRPWPKADDHYPGDWPGMPEVTRKLDDGQLQRSGVISWLAPGFGEAKTAHKNYKHFDKRWYIRRAGVIPPAGAAVHRPIELSDVKEAWKRQRPEFRSDTPRTVGIDVARSSDKTVMAGEHNMELVIHYSQVGDNHQRQRQEIVDGTDMSPGLKSWPNPKIAIDRGYAPGFADYIADRVPHVTGFAAETMPVEEQRWFDKWSEALFHMGEWLEDGGVIHDRDLRDQLVTAAREVEYDERSLNSRGPDGAQVYEATPKSEIKEELNRSPDELDAALMAIWRLRTNQGRSSTSSTWYNPYAKA